MKRRNKLKKKGEKKQMKQIFSYLIPYRARMAVGFAIKVSATIVELLIPWALSIMVDRVIPTGNIGYVFAWGGVMVLFAFLALIGNTVANRMASLVARNTTERIRLQLFSKISFLSSSQQEQLGQASLISRSTSDTYNIHQFIGMMQRLGVRQPIMLVGGLAVTLSMDAPLTCIMLALLPVMAILVYLFSSKGVPMYTKVQEAVDRFVRLVREDIAGIRVIKALSKTDTERGKFAKINEEVVIRDQRAGMIMGAMNPVMSIILNVGLVLVLFVGAKRVNAGQTTPGVIMAFMSYVTIILNSILFLSRIFVLYSKASASAKRISEVLNLPEDLMVEHHLPAENVVSAQMTTNSKTMPAAEAGANESASNLPQIIFDHVSFRYEDGHGEKCLQDVSFTVNKGETLGIIGATGSGKSTIVNLLMRYYDPDDGHIYINGRDVRTYTSKELMSLFGAAFQNDVIFHDTIYENIRFGRDVSKEEVMEAARDAQAAEFIEEKGLDTMLAIRGMDLSGGQKQRLLITRALAKRPQILVLDDSSSALDYATDARLREAIREHYGNLTSIIVAQRISSIYRADKIIVLEDGKMIGYGKHKELMESCEVYREISESQMGGGIGE